MLREEKKKKTINPINAKKRVQPLFMAKSIQLLLFTFIIHAFPLFKMTQQQPSIAK